MEIIFQTHPEVNLGGNIFRNVPVIIQIEDTPILEVGKFQPAGFTTRFPVYHSDGTKLAVVSGSQIYLTEDGKKASIKPRYEPDLTVFELEGKPILELRRQGAAALKGWAELYAPEGILIKASDTETAGLLHGKGEGLIIGGSIMVGGFADGSKIGIHIQRDSTHVGVKHIQYIGPADKPVPPMPKIDWSERYPLT